MPSPPYPNTFHRIYLCGHPSQIIEVRKTLPKGQYTHTILRCDALTRSEELALQNLPAFTQERCPRCAHHREKELRQDKEEGHAMRRPPGAYQGETLMGSNKTWVKDGWMHALNRARYGYNVEHGARPHSPIRRTDPKYQFYWRQNELVRWEGGKAVYRRAKRVYEGEDGDEVMNREDDVATEVGNEGLEWRRVRGQRDSESTVTSTEGTGRSERGELDTGGGVERGSGSSLGEDPWSVMPVAGGGGARRDLERHYEEREQQGDTSMAKVERRAEYFRNEAGFWVPVGEQKHQSSQPSSSGSPQLFPRLDLHNSPTSPRSSVGSPSREEFVQRRPRVGSQGTVTSAESAPEEAVKKKGGRLGKLARRLIHSDELRQGSKK